jgi:hypothetical protein
MTLTTGYSYGEVKLPRWEAQVIVALEEKRSVQWFPVRRLAEILGVDPETQVAQLKRYEKAQDGEVLSLVPMKTAAGWRPTLCVKRREMIAWIARIDPSHCKPSVRGALSEFQNELALAADKLFFGVAKVADVVIRNTVSLRVEAEAPCPHCGVQLLWVYEDGVTMVSRAVAVGGE